MTKSLLLSAALVGLSLTSAYSQNSEVLHYSFNTDYLDHSGNGRNLTNNNTSLTSDRYNRANSALLLNGSSYVELNNADALTLPAFSMSCWIRVDQMPNSSNLSTIVSLGTAAVDHGMNLANNYLSQYNGITTWSYKTAILTDGAFNNSFTINTNTWYFVTMARNDQRIALYVNGIKIAENTTNIGSPVYTSNNKLWIGSRYGTQSYFNGAIDEFKMFNYALADAEVDSLYKAQSATSIASNNVVTSSIFPNPSTNGNFTFAVENEIIDPSKVRIFNTLGQEVKSSISAKNDSAVNLLVEEKGTYFVTYITASGNVIREKLIVLE